MFNWLLPEEEFAFSPVARETGLQRGLDNIVEEERSVDEESEADDLKPFESLPAQAERDEPDEEGAAGVDCAAGGSRDGTGDG